MESKEENQRTQEDRIIESLVLQGFKKMHEDLDFLPIRQSLYNVENVVPEYDDAISPNIEWARPSQICLEPEYFNDSGVIAGRRGTLPDETFLGTLMAVCVFSKFDLMQNIFASRPEDFRKYGIYTCRFYVEGEWVEVITDTNLPTIHNVTENTKTLIYGSSPDINEMWIPFAEKAYAKAVGSYEAIQKVRVAEALQHLTGGSVQQLNVHDNSGSNGTQYVGPTWQVLKEHMKNDTLLLVLPTIAKPERDAPPVEDSLDGGQSTATPPGGAVSGNAAVDGPSGDAFLPDRLYSAVLLKELGGFELILMHNPWAENPHCWLGEWGNKSSDWDLYPELLQEAESDPSIPWTRANPKGFFWISFRHFKKHFQTIFLCKLFLNHKHHFYCVRGEWKGNQACGPVHLVRDKAVVVREANESKHQSIQRSTAATIIDGDPGWFNNPQYRVRVAGTSPTTLYLSIMSLNGDRDGGGHASGLSVVVSNSNRRHGASSSSSSSQPNQIHLWEASICEFVGTEKTEGMSKGKGQESSLWGLALDPRKDYHVVPHTLKKGLEGEYLLRLFSDDPIIVEEIPSLYSHQVRGEWSKTNEIDTTGGPLYFPSSNSSGPDNVGGGGGGGGVSGKFIKKENSKWCQNPQFHIELADPFSHDEVYLKILLHRTDKAGLSHKPVGINPTGEPKTEMTMGFVIVKADTLVDTSNTRVSKHKQPRQNAMGEVIPNKESSLRKSKQSSEVNETATEASNRPSRVILRKISVTPESTVFETTYSSKAEACLFFPKLPRVFLPDGLVVIPSLIEKGVKGSFEVQVLCSEPIRVTQLQDNFTRSIASEWVEGLCGGSHLSPMWKKNPKFLFKFRNNSASPIPSKTGELIPVRISLGRHGITWKSMSRKDMVGCMIGFYIFISREGELLQIYESPFVPAEEVCTDPTFNLEFLGPGEEYLIMPTTYAEGKIGSFVLSIMTNMEFTFVRDK